MCVWDRVSDPVAARSAAVLLLKGSIWWPQDRSPSGCDRVEDPVPHDQLDLVGLAASDQGLREISSIMAAYAGLGL